MDALILTRDEVANITGRLEHRELGVIVQVRKFEVFDFHCNNRCFRFLSACSCFLIFPFFPGLFVFV